MQINESSLYVVDTNVWIAADSGDASGTDCDSKSLQFLYALYYDDGEIAADFRISQSEDGLVFQEYRKRFRGADPAVSEQSASHQILLRLINETRVRYARINIDGDIAVLPDDLERLIHHDDDRKFVALSLALSSRPPIVNAKDSDWKCWKDGLCDHGVKVIQLCPELFDTSQDPAEPRS